MPKPITRPVPATEPALTGSRLELPDRFGLPALHVELEAFFELSFWFAEELQDLIAEKLRANR